MHRGLSVSWASQAFTNLVIIQKAMLTKLVVTIHSHRVRQVWVRDSEAEFKREWLPYEMDDVCVLWKSELRIVGKNS